MKFSTCIAVSFFVHILVFIPYQNSVPKKIEKEENFSNVTLISEEKPVKSSLKSDKYYNPNAEQEQMDRESICKDKDNNYIGVGMILQPGSGRVLVVPEQFPAYKAGIRIGDIIADPYGPSIVNGYIKFSVETDKKTRVVKIKAEKICYK